MTFKTFIISKKPLWVDGKLHLTVDEMFALVEEWENSNRTVSKKEIVESSTDKLGASETIKKLREMGAGEAWDKIPCICGYLGRSKCDLNCKEYEL